MYMYASTVGLEVGGGSQKRDEGANTGQFTLLAPYQRASMLSRGQTR